MPGRLALCAREAGLRARAWQSGMAAEARRLSGLGVRHGPPEARCATLAAFMGLPAVCRAGVAVAVCLAATPACVGLPANEHVQPLAGLWAFRPGDDLRWAEPDFDDRSWPRLYVPRSWARQGHADLYGFAWYRVRVPARWPASEALGLTLGKVGSAYEVFAGGTRLGGVGRLPPNPVVDFDRHVTYAMPSTARSPDGSVVIALRVWRAPEQGIGTTGPFEGRFEIGPLAEVVARTERAEIDLLVVVIVLFMAAVYHLLLAALHPGAHEYGWFGLLVLEAAIYGLLRSQLKYALGLDFVLLKKAEHVTLCLVPPTLIQVVFLHLREPCPRWTAAIYLPLLAAAAAVAFTPGLRTATVLVPLAYAAGVVVVGACLWVVVRRRPARIDEWAFAAGLLALLVALVHDGLVQPGILIGPRRAPLAFALFVVVMGLLLALRFRHAVMDLLLLQRDLEDRVAARTRELSDAYRKMEELALRDGLTRLLNRRALQDRAVAGLAAAERKRRPFAVAMVDIDHFKRVNDTHGHAVGDQVLVHIAARLTSSVRVSDDVGRWGGEEFLVLFPESDRASATVAAERIRLAVESSPVELEGGLHVPLTVSVGVAVLQDPAPSAALLDTVIRLADDAMYRAKAAGRNRVVVA